MLAIGSQALQARYPDLLTREPADLDFIATHANAKAFIRGRGFTSVTPSGGGRKLICKRHGEPPVEIEIAWPGSSAALILDYVRDKADILRFQYAVDVILDAPPLDVLYAIKLSHRYLKNSSHFQKTRNDILKMREAGAKVPEDFQEILKLRERETYTYAHPKLNVMKDNFFDGDSVPYTYDHDSIHRAISYPNPPIYTHFMKDGAEVAVDREKFEAMGLGMRVRSVLEESYVLAVERSQVPFPGVLTRRQSFEIALEKVCTSIASGWWREFAWEHYDDVLRLYKDDYLDWFEAGLKAGIVLPVTGA